MCAKQRCENPSDQSYNDYGGRGIKMLLTFEEFFAEVGLRTSRLHSIDRIDNDGNYERDNLRWATRSQQQRNKRGWQYVARV